MLSFSCTLNDISMLGYLLQNLAMSAIWASDNESCSFSWYDNLPVDAVLLLHIEWHLDVGVFITEPGDVSHLGVR